MTPNRNANLITAEGLTLHVPVVLPHERSLLTNPSHLLRDLYLAKSRREVRTLIRDVSFVLKPGERLGLLGSNGSGKTTLLRLLAGIYTPTSGTLIVNGSAKGLFDMSLGMQPEATGLENIYLRGLRMGLSLKELRKLVGEVIEFAELGEEIEKPFSTYSAGMRIRLAFAISSLLQPDILLLDEWIGVGDARFRDKVKARMMGMVDASKGLILATHNDALMKSLCTRALLLEKGSIVFDGPIDDALARYSKNRQQSGARAG